MTPLYALFGKPLGHSKSPDIHRMFAEQFGFTIEYRKIEVEPGQFHEQFAQFRRDGGQGGNITAPCKLDAFNAATRRMPRAEQAGAVNTFRYVGEEIEAENFDGLGLVRDIEVNLGMPLKGKRILLLGAGGAVRGALAPFLETAPAKLTLVNRTIEKAHALSRDFARVGDIEVLGYGAVTGAGYDIVINATSASLAGECPPISPNCFEDAEFAYELAYGKGLTPFLALARPRVGQVVDGVGMLVEQAAEGFNWWFGQRPVTGPAMQRLRVPIVG